MLIFKLCDIQSLRVFINVFPSLLKANFNTMHHFIQILTIIIEIMMQVSLHGEDYITQNTFILWIHMLVLSLHIIWHGCSLFSKCNENSTMRLRSLYNVLPALWMSHILKYPCLRSRTCINTRWGKLLRYKNKQLQPTI